MKNTTALFLALVGTFFFAFPIFAQDSCQHIFGGGQSCIQNQNLELQTFVQNPKTGAYIPTLSQQDPSYQPEQQIMLKLIVKNTSGGVLSHVLVNDLLPSEILFISGDGTFDKTTNTFTKQISPMEKGAITIIFIEGKIQSTAKLANQPLICPLNQTNAISDNIVSQNNSQFCIATTTESPSLQTSPTQAPSLLTTTISTTPTLTPTPTPTTKTTPATGPEPLSWAILFLVGGVGLLLRKRTQLD